MVVSHANRVLDWQENLMHDEMPPQWMWPFEDELTEWFEEVQYQRESRYGRSSSRDDSSVPMTSNDLARERK